MDIDQVKWARQPQTVYPTSIEGIFVRDLSDDEFDALRAEDGTDDAQFTLKLYEGVIVGKDGQPFTVEGAPIDLDFCRGIKRIRRGELWRAVFDVFRPKF